MDRRKYRRSILASLLLVVAAAVSGCGGRSTAGSLSITGAAADEPWHGRIYEGETTLRLTADELYDSLAGADNIVLGEKHYTEAVQNEQAAVIAGVVGKRGFGVFTTAWEFLNVEDQDSIRVSFAAYQRGEISGEEFLTSTQGSANALTYLPILQVTAQLNGKFIGTNLSREQKAPVVRGGLEAANPDMIPPGFAMGSDLYYERFVIAMEDHVMPGTLDNFYAAQCLTDDVLAYSMLRDATGELRFLVVGSFHTDYNDGTVARIIARSPEDVTRSVRFIDASDYKAGELAEGWADLVRDERYGKIADAVIFVNEPTPE